MKIIKIVIAVLSILALILSFGGISLSREFFIFDLFSHFQLQYTFCLLLSVIYYFFTKKPFHALGIFLYIAIIYVSVIHPFEIFPNKIADVDIFYMNTKYKNNLSEPIIEEIKKNTPKIITLVEPNEELIRRLTTTQGEPIQVINNNAYSFVTFSSLAVYEKKFIYDAPIPISYIEFEKFVLITIHAYDPLTVKDRLANIEYLAEIINTINLIQDKPFVLVGDFNNTFFSETMREHFQDYFKKHVYSWSLFKPWMIPIDHVLSNEEIDFSRTKMLSSDHAGLLIDVKN